MFVFFFTSRTKSKLYQQFIHWASPFLNHHQSQSRSFCTRNFSRPHLQLQIFFFTSRTKSKFYQRFIHWASPFLNHHQKPVAFLLHTQLFAASPTVTNFFFHFKNKIKTLSTIYQPNLSFFKPLSKASRVPCAHATFRGLTYSYKIFFLLFFFHFENKIKTLSTTYQPSLSFFNHHQKTNAYPFAHATFRGLIHGYKNELMHKAVPSQTNFLN